MLALALTRPKSTGTVTLRDRKARTSPRIALNILGEAEDRQKMVEGVEMIRRITSQGPLSDIIVRELAPGASLASSEDIIAALPTALDIYHHPTSTAPMGVTTLRMG